MSEHDEQVAFFDWVRALEPRYKLFRNIFAIPNAGGYKGGFGANMKRVIAMKREGVRKGILDIFVAIPVAPFHGMFIEAKYGENKISKEQEEYFASFTEAGYKCVVCYSGQEMIDALKQYVKV